MTELIRRAGKGDKEAFSVLMKQYETRLYRVASAILKSNDDVADAMQETILRCWQNIGSVKRPEYFGTWLTRILIHEANKIAKKRTKTLPLDELPEPMREEQGFARVEWEEMLYALDEKYRIVVVLYYAEGYKVREISEILKLGESAVKARLKIAREKLEKVIVAEKGFGER